MKTILIIILTMCVPYIKASDIEKDQIVSTATTKLKELSSIYNAFKWIKHSLSYTSTEQNKFPNIRVSKLLELCPSQESSHEKLFGQIIEYSTGSDENSSDTYKGIATIKDVDYGICRHKFVSPQEGFDKNVQRETLRKSITPYVFFNNWIKNKEDVFLLKGTPYADQGKIWMDYIVYNNQSTEFIQIKVVRTPQK